MVIVDQQRRTTDLIARSMQRAIAAQSVSVFGRMLGPTMTMPSPVARRCRCCAIARARTPKGSAPGRSCARVGVSGLASGGA